MNNVLCLLHNASTLPVGVAVWRRMEYDGEMMWKETVAAI